jgi:hypothetical protein
VDKTIRVYTSYKEMKADECLTAFFIAKKEDLIASKLAAGRTRDLADVEEIREAEAGAKKRSGSES